MFVFKMTVAAGGNRWEKSKRRQGAGSGAGAVAVLSPGLAVRILGR